MKGNYGISMVVDPVLYDRILPYNICTYRLRKILTKGCNKFEKKFTFHFQVGILFVFLWSPAGSGYLCEEKSYKSNPVKRTVSKHR